MKSEEYRGFDAAGFRQWLRDFLPTAKIFESVRGTLIIEFASFANSSDGRKYLRDTLFISTDNATTFQQLHCGGFSGTLEGDCRICEWSGEFPADWSGEFPTDGKQFRILAEGEVMTLLTNLQKGQIGPDSRWEQFKLIKNSFNLDDVFFNPLPEVRQPEYLYRRPDGVIIFADNVKHGYTYERMRLFMGVPGKLVEVPILKLERYRDGGTTFIKTDLGILFSPTPVADGRNIPAVWIHDKNAKNSNVMAGIFGEHEPLAKIDVRNNQAVQDLMDWLMDCII